MQFPLVHDNAPSLENCENIIGVQKIRLGLYYEADQEIF